MFDARRWSSGLGALVWGGGLVLLSWVPAAFEALPVLGVLRGPLGAVLLILAAGVALARRLDTRPLPDPGSGALFAVSAGLFLVLGIHYAENLRVSGDEPHYLLMAQSLWREGDLDFRDNLARQDYLEYTPGPLVPHYGAPRPDGRPFPAHSPGLPALLAPVYALGGRRACVALLALLAAALGLQVRALAAAVTSDTQSALFAWIVAVGPPVAFYAFHVYTEVPSALALALGLRILLSSPGPALSAGAALAASLLPWLHLKMIPAAAALGAVALARLRGRSLGAFLGVAGAMSTGYLAYYYALFETPTPLALYGGLPRGETGSPLVAAGGLLMDRSFGLLPHAPVFLLALAGLAILLRKPLRQTLPHALVGAAVLAPAVLWRMWWGGQSPPGRLLVPLVPLLGVCAALRMEGPPRGVARWRWGLAGMGAALAGYMAARPQDLLLLNRGDRPTRVWAAVSGETPLGRYLPSLVSSDVAERRVALVWGAALLFILVLDHLARSREAVDRAFRSLGLPLVLLLLVGVLVDRWARAEGTRPPGSIPLPRARVEAPA